MARDRSDLPPPPPPAGDGPPNDLDIAYGADDQSVEAQHVVYSFDENDGKNGSSSGKQGSRKKRCIILLCTVFTLLAIIIALGVVYGKQVQERKKLSQGNSLSEVNDGGDLVADEDLTTDPPSPGTADSTGGDGVDGVDGGTVVDDPINSEPPIVGNEDVYVTEEDVIIIDNEIIDGTEVSTTEPEPDDNIDNIDNGSIVPDGTSNPSVPGSDLSDPTAGTSRPFFSDPSGTIAPTDRTSGTFSPSGTLAPSGTIAPTDRTTRTIEQSGTGAPTGGTDAPVPTTGADAPMPTGGADAPTDGDFGTIEDMINETGLETPAADADNTPGAEVADNTPGADESPAANEDGDGGDELPAANEDGRGGGVDKKEKDAEEDEEGED